MTGRGYGAFTLRANENLVLHADTLTRKFGMDAWGVRPISSLAVDRRQCVSTKTEITNCLRDLQTVATIHITEEQIAELVKKELIQRVGKTGRILLTPLGVYTKTGQI